MFQSLFRPHCLLCHAAAASALCSGCLNDLAYLYTDARHACPLCARHGADCHVCGRCQQHPPPFRAFWASLRYTDPLPEILHQFKHQKHTALGRVLIDLMQANPPPWLPQSGIDSVLAMPVSPERRLERGFNQCDDLAAWVARHYQLALLPHDTVRRRHKPPQSTLSAAERQKNVRHIFQAADSVKNRKILIIDDVKTTGVTLSELAATLNKAGAAGVWAWTSACKQ